MVDVKNNLCVKIGTFKCFKCIQPDHRSSEYPLRKAIYIVEGMKEQEISESDVEGVGFDEVEFALRDEEEKFACITQRILLTPKGRNSQRHSIFRTSCTINRKVCEVIVDGGSSENVVFKNLMNARALVIL